MPVSNKPARPDIAIFIHSLGGGGAERVAVTLCNALAAQHKRVHLIVLENQGRYWEMLSPLVEVFDLRRNRMWKAICPLRRYLRTYRPPTLLCFMTRANGVGIIANLLAFKPSRVVVSERAVFSFFGHAQQGFGRYVHHWMPLFYHLADGVICVSRGVADDLRQFVSLPPKKVTVIYNPSIRTELYDLKEMPVDHPYLVPGQPPVLLAVGAFRPEKNYELLLRAFAAIDKSWKARLLILGEGPDRAAIEQLLAELNIADYVDMPGFSKNPYAYMSRATAFIMCSNSEGLPNALIEALACGCPVIATDCPGGMREILEDGKYGLLVPKGDQGKLTAAINHLLENPVQAQNRVDAFHREKLHLFTPETVIPQYCEILGFGSNIYSEPQIELLRMKNV